MALRARHAAHEAARRRAHHGLAPHDRADGGADRDARRPRRRRALGVVQHLQHPGPRRRRGRGRPRRAPSQQPQGIAGLRLEGRDARGVLVVHQRGAGVARRRRTRPDRRRRRRRHAARAQGPRVRARRQRAGLRRGRASPRSGASSSRCSAGCSARRPASGSASRPRSAASARRPPPACTASTRWRRRARCSSRRST